MYWILHAQEWCLHAPAWDGCQDGWLSGKAVVICVLRFLLKRRIYLYVIEIFWKDIKEAVNSEMPLKKDTGGLERKADLFLILCPFVFFETFFLLLYACIIISVKKESGVCVWGEGGGFKKPQSPQALLASQLLCLQPGPRELCPWFLPTPP